MTATAAMYSPPVAAQRVLASRRIRGSVAQVAAWLAAQGYPVRPVPVYLAGTAGGASAQVEADGGVTVAPEQRAAWNTLGNMVYDPRARRTVRRVTGRGGVVTVTSVTPPPNALGSALHELLHQGFRSRWDQASPAERALEEGVVEAVAQDLMPAAARRFRLPAAAPGVVYPDRVRWVREASARATGRPWASYQARVWRRNLLRAADRAAILPDLGGLS